MPEVDGQGFVASLHFEAFTSNCQLEEGFNFNFFDQDSRAIEAFALVVVVVQFDAVVVLLY